MDHRRSHLLAQLAVYDVHDAFERRSVALLQRYLTWLSEPFNQHADPTHVTASAIVLYNDSVLVHWHKRLHRYLQPGGHIDADESAPIAAARELYEETGVSLVPGPLVHVDLHAGPRGHVHFDLRFRFTFDGNQQFAPRDGESTDVRLVTVTEILATGEDSLRRAVKAARAS